MSALGGFAVSRCQALFLVFVRSERRETSAQKQETKLDTAKRHSFNFLLPSVGANVVREGVPRRLRLERPDGIYHLIARGNGRQDILCDHVDRDRLQEQLGRAVIRCSWRVYAFAIMSNHIHVVLKTPQPNLARGMQAFLSGYANAWSRRHRFGGHVFQGRYRTEAVRSSSSSGGASTGKGDGSRFFTVLTGASATNRLGTRLLWN